MFVAAPAKRLEQLNYYNLNGKQHNVSGENGGSASENYRCLIVKLQKNCGFLEMTTSEFESSRKSFRKRLFSAQNTDYYGL